MKAVFVEHFNRTLLDLIKEPMYIEGKGNWLNHLDAALQKYNNRVHGTTKMTQFEMSFDKPIPRSYANPIPNDNKNLPTFQVGDFVRVPDKRSVYSKVIQQIGTENFLKYTKFNEPSIIHFGR